MSSPFLRHVPLVLWCGVSLALAQQTQTAPVVPSPPPQTPAPAQKPPEEMVQKEQPALFQARVSLVAVPVVVRDKAGKAVGNLKKEDFQLFDRGKPQFIARFSMEKAGTRVINPVVVEAADPTAGAVQGKPMEVADGFTALLFDDVHGEFADLARARDAAQKYIDNSLKASERFAIYTTSGQTIQDFTDDRVLLKATLLKLMPRPVTGQGGRSCPEMTYYSGDRIINKNDPQVLEAAVQDVMQCMNMMPEERPRAQQMAEQAARNQLVLGDHETRLALGVIKHIIYLHPS